MFHHRALRTMIAATALVGLVALGGPTVASVDSKAAAAPSQRGPNNENYDPPIYTPTARPAYEGTPGNPLVRGWGVYQGLAEHAWLPYLAASAEQQALLDKIVQRPKATWFGHWQPDGDITDRVEKYIELTTGGDPDVLVQISIFRMVPWERGGLQAAAHRRPSRRRTRRGSTASSPVWATPTWRSSCSPTARSRCALPASSKLPVEADQVRRPQAQRPAQHQRLHRRRRGRLEPRGPEEGAEDAASRWASAGPAASR